MPPCPFPLCRRTWGTVRPTACNVGIIYRRPRIAQHDSYPFRRRYFERSPLPAEEQSGGRAHHVGVPHRVEGELGVHGLDALDGEGLRLDLLLDQIPNRA